MVDETSVPCGIAVPQVFPDGPIDMGLVHRFAARAEALGYHSLWVQERLLGGAPTLEPIGLLNHVSAVTNTIRLGTAVVIVSTRNPVLLAKELGSLDQMSGGRLIAGLALGGQPRQYPLLGGPSERRVSHFVESLELMTALWSQPEVTFHGEFWTLDRERMEPRPVQQPHPPVWFGGRHPDALRRATRYGDGWMGAGSTTTEQFVGHVRTIREALDTRGRDPESFAISKRVYIALDDDEVRAERRLAEWFGRQYGDAGMASRVSVWGGVDRCVEGLSEVIEGGAEMLMLNPVFDHLEHLQALNAEVVPRLSLT
jgi:probable F420-dependent oxidoreductase